MKKTILITLIALSMSVNAMACKNSSGSCKENKGSCKGKSNEQHQDGVVALPHLMKVIITNSEALKIDKKQQEQFDAIMQKVPADMHTMMDEAGKLEFSIKKAVMKNKKTNADVKADVETLQILNAKITTLQIGTINKLQEILSDAQYKQLLDILHSKKKSKNKKSCE
jgi:uncharacterized protein YdeI (BOF family)